MKLIKIEKLKTSTKKFKAHFQIDKNKTKSVSFGAKGYRDFTLISNKSSKFYIADKTERNLVKERYIRRHRSNENWLNPLTAGSLSRWILWEKSTISQATKEFKKRFKI